MYFPPTQIQIPDYKNVHTPMLILDLPYKQPFFGTSNGIWAYKESEQEKLLHSGHIQECLTLPTKCNKSYQITFPIPPISVINGPMLSSWPLWFYCFTQIGTKGLLIVTGTRKLVNKFEPNQTICWPNMLSSLSFN